jgi:hypothetical protein
MDRLVFRKPRQFFDTSTHPSHVTFDDGTHQKKNLPWMHYVEARWDYAEPDAIKLTIGEWLVVITGHNLSPLFIAIEEHTLVRVCAHPEYRGVEDRDADSFATDIRFLKSAAALKRKSQAELDLGGV